MMNSLRGDTKSIYIYIYILKFKDKISQYKNRDLDHVWLKI